MTTPIPDPGLPLLAEAGEVTVLPEPLGHARFTQLCACGDHDAVLTQRRDRLDAQLLAQVAAGVETFAPIRIG